MNIKHLALTVATAATLALAPAAQAIPIAGLVNTGAGLASGAQDVNYGLEVLAGSTQPGSFGYVGTNVHPNWMANDATSQWITPFQEGQQSLDPLSGGNGVYRWTLSFTLGEFSTAYILGRWSADNYGSLYLNGTLIDFAAGFYEWSDFSAYTELFRTGLNVLEFVVTNTSQDELNPTGVRIEILGSNVPEPEGIALMLGAMGALALASRRRQRK